LFDLPVGDARIRPDAAGRLPAPASGQPQAPAQGNVGAGAGALVGKLFGIARAMKGGIGSAAVTRRRRHGRCAGGLQCAGRRGRPGHRRGAGRRPHPDGRRAARHPRAILAGEQPQPLLAGTNTTLGRGGHRRGADQGPGAPAGPGGARRAGARDQSGAHDVRWRHGVRAGHRGVRHSRADDALATLAAEVTARAVVRAVLAAHGVTGADHWPAACDLSGDGLRGDLTRPCPGRCATPWLSLRELLVSAGPFIAAGVAAAGTGLLVAGPEPAAARDAGHRAGPERLRRVRRALPEGPGRAWHRGGAAAERGIVRQPALVRKAGPTSVSCRAAARTRPNPTDTDGAAVAGRPVPGAGLAVLPQRSRTQATGRTPGQLRGAAGPARQRRHARQRRAAADAALFELNRLDAARPRRSRSSTRHRPNRRLPGPARSTRWSSRPRPSR
jgi:hypothetical protein